MHLAGATWYLTACLQMWALHSTLTNNLAYSLRDQLFNIIVELSTIDPWWIKAYLRILAGYNLYISKWRRITATLIE